MTKKRWAYLLLTLLALCFIWGNSMMPGEVSGEISGGIFQYVSGLFAVFGDKGEYVLRKLAHFSEYTLLGYLLTGLTRPVGGPFRPTRPLFLGLSAACLDETIQIFSPGRGSSLIDVWIDFSGVCLGLLLWLGVHTFKKRFQGNR